MTNLKNKKTPSCCAATAAAPAEAEPATNMPIESASAAQPAPAAQPAAASAPAAQPDEADVAHLLETVYRHPRHRELYYKTLAFCQEERTVDEAEDFLEEQPEFTSALQMSTVLVNVLIEEGGLAYSEYDAQGVLITEDRLEELRTQGADEDSLYDLVWRRCVTATPAARAVIALLDPAQRVRSYATSVPERMRIYRTLLDFCLTPRALDDIRELLDGDPALAPSERTSWQKLHASFFIDRMDEAGGLVWQGGWVTTAAGRAFLATDDDR